MRKAQVSVEVFLVLAILSVTFLLMANYAGSFSQTAGVISIGVHQKTILENSAQLADLACANKQKISFSPGCINSNSEEQFLYLSGQTGKKIVVSTNDLITNYSKTINCEITGLIPLSCLNKACFNGESGSVMLEEGC